MLFSWQSGDVSNRLEVYGAETQLLKAIVQALI